MSECCPNLATAAAEDCEPCLVRLLSLGIDPNKNDALWVKRWGPINWSQTPLDFAMRYGNSIAAARLAEAGATLPHEPDVFWLVGTDILLDALRADRRKAKRSNPVAQYATREDLGGGREKVVHLCGLVEYRLNGFWHRDGGPALDWSQRKKKEWFLNRVQVPQWLAETPAGQIDCKQFYKIENADVLREFVRKVGYERLCYELGAKVVDGKDGEMYQLLSLEPPERVAGITISMGPIPARERANIGGEQYEIMQPRSSTVLTWLFLRMVNPSLSTPENPVYHIEGVGQNCKTVDDALLWRLNGDEEKYAFSENGQDWFIHGDVLLVPVGARFLKPRPAWVA